MHDDAPVVVVVGSLNMDLVVRAPHHPHPGETVLGGPFATFNGGKGANQAVAAARLGTSVRMIGRVGHDAFGRALRSALSDDGIDVEFVGVCKHDPTGVALITVDDLGENTIVVAAGANAKLRPEHVDDAVKGGCLSGARTLVAQLEIPIDAVRMALSAARAAGIVTMLNAAPAVRLDDGLLALVDVLVVNRGELAVLAGTEDERVARDWAATRVGALVLTKGSEGLVADDHRAGSSFQLAARPVEVVDTTGAGDACCGAIAAALARGYDLGTAVMWGNAAGALAVGRSGAQPSLPAIAELLAAVPGPESAGPESA